MLVDNLTEFTDNEDVSGVAATANLADQIDLGVAGRDVGTSYRNASVVISVDAAFVGGTSSQFQLVSDSVAAIDTAGAQSVHAITKAFTPAELTLGRKIVLPLVPDGGAEPYERFLGVQIVRVGTLTTGNVSASISHDAGQWKAYDDAVN